MRPGMMRNPWTLLHRVIRSSSIVLEIVDTRFPETRSPRLEQLVKKYHKHLLVIYNKSDLVKQTPQDGIAFSSKTRTGKNELISAIMVLGGGKVAVIGYPNVGKSSLINTLTGRSVAKISPIAGCTRGKQWIRVNPQILMLDTPGIIPTKMTGEELALIGAFDPVYTDPVLAFYQLLPHIKNDLTALTPIPKNPEKILEKLALHWKMVKKGGIPDVERAALQVLRKWQAGKKLM